MRFAFLFDIHANLPALQAVLTEVASEAPDRVLHGGDLIGWGPQPNEVVEVIAEQGIQGVVGNHELLCLGAFTEQHPLRNASTQWTAQQLTSATREFLGHLPPQIATENFWLSHAVPTAWHEPPDAGCFPYLHSSEEVRQYAAGLEKAPGRLTIVGHVHLSAVYRAHEGDKVIERRKLCGTSERLDSHVSGGEWSLVMVGAVGKPRDGVSTANYALLDTATKTISLRRVPYDVESTCALLRRTKGLPQLLAEQLAAGI
ncbi:MAG: metallophosphoesterase family protein [Candidatus Zipacnadales bacterium]